MSKMNKALGLLVGASIFATVGCGNTPAKTPEATTVVESESVTVVTPPPTKVYVIPIVLDSCAVPAESHASFEFAADTVENADEPELTDIAACLTKGALGTATVQLVGHTDPRGSQAFNQQLGMSRAEHVAKFLEAHGVAADRIAVSSKGKEDAGMTEKDWPGDRRVDVSITMPKAAPAPAAAGAPGG